MVRRIPIFEFNEELSPKKHQVYKSLIDGVTEAINYFAKMKQLPEKEFLKLFIVTEIK